MKMYRRTDKDHCYTDRWFDFEDLKGYVIEELEQNADDEDLNEDGSLKQEHLNNLNTEEELIGWMNQWNFYIGVYDTERKEDVEMLYRELDDSFFEEIGDNDLFLREDWFIFPEGSSYKEVHGWFGNQFKRWQTIMRKSKKQTFKIAALNSIKEVCGTKYNKYLPELSLFYYKSKEDNLFYIDDIRTGFSVTRGHKTLKDAKIELDNIVKESPDVLSHLNSLKDITTLESKCKAMLRLKDIIWERYGEVGFPIYYWEGIYKQDIKRFLQIPETKKLTGEIILIRLGAEASELIKEIGIINL